MLHVLALPGSLRRASFNRLLLAAAARSAPAGMTVSLFADLGSIPLFSEDLEEPALLPAAVGQLRREVESADGVLVAGVLKNAVDWLSRRDEVLAEKPVAVIGASTGPWGTRLAQSALRQVLHATGSLVLPAPALYARDAALLFDQDGQLVDEPTRQALETLLARFAHWIERTGPADRSPT
jgi:chromate reductase